MNEFVEKLRDLIKGRFVVYIDVANLEHSVRDMFVRYDDIPDEQKHKSANELRWTVDYSKFNDFFKASGDFGGIRFYSAEFMTESHKKFCYFLKKRLGFKLVTKPLKEYEDHADDHPHSPQYRLEAAHWARPAGGAPRTGRR